MIKLFQGDSLRVLPACVQAGFVDAVITDPPYGLGFMSRDWDQVVPGPPFWKEALRVSKPGAYLLAFGGSRTSHRLTCAIEDSGWEIRDTLMWVYASGFPKSQNIALAIDKAAGRPNRGHRISVASSCQPNGTVLPSGSNMPVYEPEIEEASEWNGWGTALKPAYEPIIVARKPFKGTLINNVLTNGTGAMNIDACRIPFESEEDRLSAMPGSMPREHKGFEGKSFSQRDRSGERPEDRQNSLGRFPSNFMHDGSEEVVSLFPAMGPGNASRIFFSSKASPDDRGEGNTHPTVKPVSLIEYLVRLVTRRDSIVLDLFMGSGSTGVACARVGDRHFIGVDLDPGYVEIAKKRIREAL